MGQPVYIAAQENDANGCLLEASVVGSYGFRATSEKVGFFIGSLSALTGKSFNDKLETSSVLAL
jgi:hypothetical protein